MTKSELINKFSENAGIIESDAKLFFELLLKRLAEILKSGQSILIQNLGYFRLIKGKIKLPQDENFSDRPEDEKINIILYSEEEKLEDSETKGFVFNIPSFDEEDNDPIDSHFSLSIGKPLIPLLGIPDQNTYLPKSGPEQKRFLESKIREIVSSSKIIASEEEFPTLIIDASSYNSDQLHLEKPEDDLESLLSDEEKEGTLDDVGEEKVIKNIAWDFGEYYTKKISAESVLQLTDQILNNPKEEKQNIDENVQEEKSDVEDEKILDVLLENESANENEIRNSDENNEQENKGADSDSNDIELINEEKNAYNIDNETELENIVTQEDATEDLSDEEFWKNTSKLFETYNPKQVGTDPNTEFSEAFELNDEAFEEDSQKIKLATDKSGEETIEEKVGVEKDNVINSGSEVKLNKKSKRWLLIFIPIVLLLLAVAYYFYIQKENKNQIRPEQKILSLKSDNAEVIQRNFEFPITYPYPPKNEIANSDSIANKNHIVEKNKTTDQLITNVKSKETNVSDNKAKILDKDKVPSGEPVNMGNNIYRYGNIYVVQVAAFRSNLIAENEAGRYRNKGYNSFIERVDIPGRGLWYRIRVGNFSTLEEANNFISKSKR